VDVFTPPERSRIMSAVRHEGTAPELRVRRILHAMGYRFSLHVRSLPGCPDIVLSKYRTVLLVNGCFWHGHWCRRGKEPTTNRAFWLAKIAMNAARDRRVAQRLRRGRWRVVTIWECRVTRSSGDELRDYLLRHLPGKRSAARWAAKASRTVRPSV
jgi:DNA mismatch endonuclease (patch repair protein)